jgi:hypothetical protein
MKPIARQEFLKHCARGGALAGIVALGAVLVSRENKFACSDQCRQCVKFRDGKCGLGLK